MPTIHANTNDGIIFNVGQSSHANARDASSGNSINTTSTNSTAQSYFVGIGRAGLVFRIDRWFWYFDTSGITSTVASATISFARSGTINDKFDLVKSDAFGGDGQTALATSDFDALVGFSAGNTMDGNVTKYCDDVIGAARWGGSVGDYNDTDIDLNSTALSDMVSNDFFICAMVDHANDFLNSAGTNVSNALSLFSSNYTGTTRDPKIEYTLASTGYTHDISGLAAANISKVNTVATANIGKINSLD